VPTSLNGFLAWNALNNDIDIGSEIVYRTRNRFSNAASAHIGRLFGILLLFIVGAALIPTIANATTGITIAHTGFTPNPNVTGTAGLTPLIQILPLIFVGILLGFGIDELSSVL